MDNIIVNKVASIERCLERVEEEYQAAGDHFPDDYTRQDAAILNLLRACEQSIDLANHLIRIKQLGIPQTNRESFDILQEKDIISQEMADILKAMVGFRNIAVHNYTKLEMKIVQNIIEEHLKDIRGFAKEVLGFNA